MLLGVDYYKTDRGYQVRDQGRPLSQDNLTLQEARARLDELRRQGKAAEELRRWAKTRRTRG